MLAPYKPITLKNEDQIIMVGWYGLRPPSLNSVLHLLTVGSSSLPLKVLNVLKALGFDFMCTLITTYIHILVLHHKVYLWVHLRTQCILLELGLWHCPVILLWIFHSQKILRGSSRISLHSSKPQSHPFSCLRLKQISITSISQHNVTLFTYPPSLSLLLSISYGTS